jgi:hypothetical protein
MKLQKIIYVPEARVEFSAEDVNALFAASREHYDTLCRQQSEPGGMLWGLRNRIEYPPVERCLTTHDIDLLSKISERIKNVLNDDRRDAVISGIRSELHRIFRTLNDEYKRLNP